MCAHVDIALNGNKGVGQSPPGRSVRKAINAMLRKSNIQAAVLRTAVCDESFSARHSCLNRRYIYRILANSDEALMPVCWAW